MEFRLTGDTLEALYARGEADALSAAAIGSFFSLLEAIESADDLDDLRALRSLGMTQTGSSVAFSLADGFVARARLLPDSSAGKAISFDALPERP